MDAKVCLVYDSKEFPKLLVGLEVSPFMKLKGNQEALPFGPYSSNQDTPDIPLALGDLSVSETLFCSYCNVGFLDQSQQRQHYKLDWHRYNLKQHLALKKHVSEEKFAQLADDLSSISGSGSDSDQDDSSTDVEIKSGIFSEDNRLSQLIARRSRILFNNSVGNVISLNRCLLLNKKEEPVSDEYLVDLVKKLPNKSTWLIVMLGGGHFAAAIFKSGEPLVHKTFHSYTVRSKQGGSQSSKDGKGVHAKSAGASMRRYNEQSLTQHVQDVMKSWGPEINKCDYIFYRAIGPGNTNVLFGGPNAPLLRQDPRVKSIPFTTRRPTFNEVKRVQELLATVFVYDSNEMFRTQFLPPKVVKEIQETEPKVVKSPRPKRIDRAKERPSPDRQLPQIVQDLAAETSSEDGGSLILEVVSQETSFIDDLQEYGDSVEDKNSPVISKPKKKKKKPEKDNLRPELQQFWKKIHGSCETGDADALKEHLENYSESVDKDELSLVLNQKNIDGHTVLHKMAAEGKGSVVRLLMLHGCDPCVKDKKTLTPYDHCPDKITRNVFRKFMGEFPDMFEYSKSHIPSALTDSMEAEISEKKRQLRKAKRQKEKEKKQQLEVQRQEEEEKNRFLALSDKEKRALAAERRILALSGSNSVTLSRCFLCAADITGKVPFEYDNNRFCSMPCLKSHRLSAKKL